MYLKLSQKLNCNQVWVTTTGESHFTVECQQKQSSCNFPIYEIIVYCPFRFQCENWNTKEYKGFYKFREVISILT